MSSRKWGIVYIFACSFFVVAVSIMTANPDVFWHLKVGEWIFQHKSIPKVDVYSWSAYGQLWTAHQWAWEVLIYLLHKHAGIIGLWVPVLLSGILTVFFIQRGLMKRNVSCEVASIAGGAAVLLLIQWFRPWPQVGVYACIAAYFYLSLQRMWTKREILLAVGTAVVWANIHSSVVIFPLLLIAEYLWLAVITKKKDNRRLWGAVVAGFATLITPHGINLWIYAVREGLATQIYRETILEWMPYVFGFHFQSLIFLVSVLVIFFAVQQNQQKSLEFVRAVGFWILALMSRIYTPYAVLSTVVLFGLLNIKIEKRVLKLLTGVILAMGITAVVRTGMPVSLDDTAVKEYPVKAVEQIKKHNCKKVYNDYGWGGYLIWKDIPVYIDGRADLYAYKKIFKNYMNIQENSNIGNTIKETGADCALVKSHGFFDHALRYAPGWKEIYRDRVCVLYLYLFRI